MDPTKSALKINSTQHSQLGLLEDNDPMSKVQTKIKKLLKIDWHLDENDFTSPAIQADSGYQLTDCIQQFRDLPFEVKVKQKKEHHQLAAIYETIAKELAAKKGFFDSWRRSYFTDRTNEYNEALCIAHLTIASLMGCAKSSYQLAVIYKKGDYYLPTDTGDKDAKALEYATKAQKQGDTEALFNLGKLYEADEIFFDNPMTKQCYVLADNEKHQGAHDKLHPKKSAFQELGSLSHRGDTF
jgi:hypothetical protein